MPAAHLGVKGIEPANKPDRGGHPLDRKERPAPAERRGCDFLHRGPVALGEQILDVSPVLAISSLTRSISPDTARVSRFSNVDWELWTVSSRPLSLCTRLANTSPRSRSLECQARAALSSLSADWRSLASARFRLTVSWTRRSSDES